MLHKVVNTFRKPTMSEKPEIIELRPSEDGLGDKGNMRPVSDFVVSDSYEMAVTPVTSQPGLYPGAKLNASGGLDLLKSMSSVILKEEREIMECLCGDKIPCGPWCLGCGPPKKRFYLGDLQAPDQPRLILEEESDCLPRRCYTKCRPFRMTAMDANTRQEQFRIVRDFECLPCISNSCAPFYGYYADMCAQAFKVRIELPDGTALGFVEQRSSCCSIEFDIMDRSHQTVYQFKTTMTNGCCSNPCCLAPCMIPSLCRWLTCCSPIVAQLTTPGGNEVGSVSWNYPGCSDAFFFLKHQFHIDFPGDADADMRATLIGAAVIFENFFGTYHPIWFHS